MSAQPCQFSPYLQELINEGHLNPHQAWRLAWDLEAIPELPWSPGVAEICQVADLYFLPTDRPQ